MKKISLKVKLTLLYTFFMVLLTCAALRSVFTEQQGNAVLCSGEAYAAGAGEYREY